MAALTFINTYSTTFCKLSKVLIWRVTVAHIPNAVHQGTIMGDSCYPVTTV